MTERRASPASRRRLAWALFCGVAILVLGVGVLKAQATGGWTNAALILVGGLVAIGIAALLMSAILSPIPDRGGSGQPYGSRGMGSTGLEGGGHGVGDYAGGGDSST